MAPKSVFKIVFHNNDQVYEIYARRLNQGTMLGFVEVEELIFGEKSSIVVDPSEEKLRAEFEGVKRLFIPMHSVVRIDEVEKKGPNKILSSGQDEKVTPFPSPMYTPPNPDSQQ